MAKTSQTQDSTAKGEASRQAMEERLQELEYKTSFLEKELEEYKEASRGFYKRINDLEEEVRKLRKDAQETDQPTPEVSWDSEGRNIRP